MSSPNGKSNAGPARDRYWRKHDKPARKLQSPPNMQKRIRASEFTLMQTIADLGAQSDLTVLRMKGGDLLRNRAFVEHSAKLSGAIGRLAQRKYAIARGHDQVASVDGLFVVAVGSARIPHRAELDAQRSAFKTLDLHYEPCGKRSKTNKCKLGNGHINDCKEQD